MASFTECVRLQDLPPEDVREIRGYIDAANGDEKAGVEAYLAGLKSDLADLEEQVSAALDKKAGKKSPAAKSIDAPASKERIEDMGEKIGGARKDTATSTGPRGSRPKSGDDAPAWRKRYAVMRNWDMRATGADAEKWMILDTRTNRSVRDGFRTRLFDTEAEAEAAIPLSEVSRNHRVVSEPGGTFAIVRVISDRKRPKIKGGFETREAAQRYMAENAVEIIETKTRIDDSIHPALEQALREGEARREGGRDVTGQDFMDIFGFRGVEFGNWNNNAERQHILNQGFDALLDLAEITDLPPKALSLNGELAIAFGARGHGLQGARAHYERDYGVINITKIKGAGSLAHEWMHAVDHYFARQDGKAKAEKVTNKRGDEVFDASTNAANDYISHSFRRDSGVRKEVLDAIKAVMDAIYKRRQQFTEDVSTREKIEDRAGERLDQVLKQFRDDLASEQQYGRKKAPATKQQLLKVDQLIKRIKRGEVGEMAEAPTKARWSKPVFHEPVLKLAEIYKEVRGRQAYRNVQGRNVGYAYDIENAITQKQQADKFLADAKEQRIKEKTVRTEFASEAWKMDQGAKKDYWSTNHEMMARAFEAYVYDRLQDIDARNDFLAYEKHNQVPEYLLLQVKPYPDGQEREAINDAFRNLFDTIQTEETPEGTVRMYRRQTDTFAAEFLSDLKKRLDKLMIRNVDLRFDPTMPEQGATEISPNGDMAILIGVALNDTATLNHEAVHVLRARGLFKDREWAALREAADQNWIKKYDIATRYADLDREGQIEEAVAEAFADWTNGNLKVADAPKGALARIKRFFKALIEALRGQNITTPSDIFRAIDTGAVGAREGGVPSRTGMAAQRVSAAVRRWRDGLTRLLQNPTRKFPEVSAGKVGPILRSIGIPEGEIYMAGGKIRRVIKDHPEAHEAMMSLPDLLNDPDAVIEQNREDSDFRIVTSRRTADGRPIIANLKVDGQISSGDEARIVMTVYGWNDSERAMRRSFAAGRIRYVRDDTTARRLGLKGDAPPKIGKASVRSGGEGNILTRADIFKRREQRQPKQAEPAPRGPGPLLEPVHVPDRRIWDEITAKNATILGRLKNGVAAGLDALDKARFRVQDRFLPVLRAQQAIERATGEKLPEYLNAYLVEETFSGRAGVKLDDIDAKYVEPILSTIGGTDGLTVDMVDTWLAARHAPERNRRISQINKDMPDGAAGSVIHGGKNVRLTTQNANAIVSEMRAGPYGDALGRISEILAEMRRDIMDLRVDAGLLSRDEADGLMKMYRHYVPLRGFMEVENAEQSMDAMGVGRRYNIRGRESKRALGRVSQAASPLRNMITQAQETVIRAEKNRVGRSVHDLAVAYPSERMWTIKTPEQKRVFNKASGMVEKITVGPITAMLDPNEMAVKVDGVEKRIKFHDQRLAEALGNVGVDGVHGAVAVSAAFNRYLSMMITTLDPEFMIRNAFRDGAAAMINVGTDVKDSAELREIRKAMLKNWPKAWAGAMGGLNRKVDTEWQKYFREFQEAGAKVTFFNLDSPEAGLRDFDHRLRLRTGPKWARAIKTATSPRALISTRDNPVLGFVERMNLATDNAIRLAAFVEARKRGWSKQRAASLAKNLTVNFNRRGTETGWLNGLFLFFNAAVQGLHVTARAVTTKRGLTAIGILFAYGFAKEIANAMLSAEDDDGELAYDKIPDYKRRMNDIWMVGEDGETAITIPLPYIYAVFPYMGQQAARVMRGVTDVDDAVGEVFITALQQTSPIGVTEGFGGVLPTVLQTPYELSVNRDWLGRPIRPPMHYNDYGPNAYKFYPGASEAARQVADTLNRRTGGSTSQSGLIDISPEYIDHVAGFLTGGMGRFVGRSADLTYKLANGQEVDPRDIPIVRQLRYETGVWMDRNRFYTNTEVIKDAHKRVQMAIEAAEFEVSGADAPGSNGRYRFNPVTERHENKHGWYFKEGTKYWSLYDSEDKKQGRAEAQLPSMSKAWDGPFATANIVWRGDKASLRHRMLDDLYTSATSSRSAVGELNDQHAAVRNDEDLSAKERKAGLREIEKAQKVEYKTINKRVTAIDRYFTPRSKLESAIREIGEGIRGEPDVRAR